MIVYVFLVDTNGPVIADADMVVAEETQTGGLSVTKYAVEEDGSLTSQGTSGYARGLWLTYEEVEMPSSEVKARIVAAEQREAEAEDARSLRIGTHR